jgi:hypothetical protein
MHARKQRTSHAQPACRYWGSEISHPYQALFPTCRYRWAVIDQSMVRISFATHHLSPSSVPPFQSIPHIARTRPLGEGGGTRLEGKTHSSPPTPHDTGQPTLLWGLARPPRNVSSPRATTPSHQPVDHSETQEAAVAVVDEAPESGLAG